MLLFNNHVEPLVLRESIRTRVAVTPVTILATIASICFFTPFLVVQGVPYTQLVLWMGPLILLMAARGFLVRRISAGLDEYTDSELFRAQRMLRVSSIVNMITAGMSIWIVSSPSADSIVVPLFMTLIVVIWSMGAMANLFSDFPTFIISMPFLIGETAIFWLVHSNMGISIGLSMLLAAFLMVLLVRRGTEIFRDSVLMRFEKDQLLRIVEEERALTVQALREARAANESKAYFMAAASHDIKQPLLAIGLLTDTLLMADLSDTALPILERQRESISAMSAHLDALMEIGRIQNPHFELNLTRFRLGKFFASIDAEIAPLCVDKGLHWKTQIDDVLVTCDKELLLRMLRNLLVNAARYTDHGEVCCTTAIQGEFIEFIISDTGCGIAPEHQQAIFKEFVRLNQKGDRSVGAGLGLSIVDKINEVLNLGLQMSSAPGKGTQFSFHLPVVFDT